MPPLIAALLVGAGAYAGLKAMRRILTSVSEAGNRQQAAAPEAYATEKDLGPLELDPSTGVYRPTKPIQ